MFFSPPRSFLFDIYQLGLIERETLIMFENKYVLAATARHVRIELDSRLVCSSKE